MKKRLISLLLMMTTILSGIPLSFADVEKTEAEPFKGVWVATVLNIDYPSKGTTDVDALKKQATEILDRAAANGLNAVILQVRPTGDAFYKSNIFPWSKYLTGKQGQAPNNGFDPLEYWITEAHKRNLELHAWINPFRVTKKTKNETSYDYDSLADNNPAKLHPEWTVKYNDGNIYYDPGIPAARSLIIDGIAEIITNYDVDGIHFDDYFYPGTDFDDAETYKQYGKDFSNVGDFRRHNVDVLIEDAYRMIKSVKPDVQFGISPFGIWANKKDNAEGSDTKGMQSYYDHYADSKGWVDKEIIDYIAPQIYWNIGYTVADYQILANWWNDVCKNSSVKLYIGHAAYRTGNTDSKSAWYGVDEIKRQLTLNTSLESVQGSIFYNNTAFVNQPKLGTLVKDFFAANQYAGTSSSTASATGSNAGTTSSATTGTTGTTVTASKVTPKTYDFVLSRPSEDLKTSATSYYLAGASNKDLPLYLNGEAVSTRTTNGFFGIYVPLKDGKNTFVFKQGDKTITRVITKGTDSGTISPMTNYAISHSTVFPTQTEMRQADEKITFTCKAPIGSTVKVTFGGQTVDMTPKLSKSPDGKVYATTYSYEYTIPALASGEYERNLGKPVYNMVYGNIKDEAVAAGNVIVLGSQSVYSAAVSESIVDLLKAPTSGNGIAANLESGMMDQITGMTGSYARLASGYWINQDNITIVKNSQPYKGSIVKLDYQSGGSYDRLTIGTKGNGTVLASYDGSKITVVTSGLTNPGKLSINTDNIKTLSATSYEIPITNLKGYYVEQVSTGYSVVMLKAVAKAKGELPLSGYTILLDPGHGGSDAGARGLLGSVFTEKTINLNTALALKKKLEGLGAVVKLTRETDVDVSLKERLEMSLKLKPDLFLSIHADSLDDTQDISKVFGFSVFYKDPVAKGFSNQLLNQVLLDLGRKDRGSNQKNLYVTRGTWTPSALIETGFVANPAEYEWLLDANSQTTLVNSLASAIQSYFNTLVQ